MNNNNDIVGSTKGTSKLTRARFGPGMLLQHGDLEQLNNYTRDLSRLLFQSFFGCGVVCGLTVEGTEDCGRLKVTVQPGVALTCVGDPVHVPEVHTVWTRESFKPENAKDVWVKLCRKTRCCSPRTTTCSSDDDEATSDCTREKEGFEIHVVTVLPECACACDDTASTDILPTDYPGHGGFDEPSYPRCHSSHYKGECGCSCGECSDCDCECILLARLYWGANQSKWLSDHRVRRFIRPMLIPDPALEIDKSRQALETADSSAETVSARPARVAAKAKGRKRTTKVNA